MESDSVGVLQALWRPGLCSAAAAWGSAFGDLGSWAAAGGASTDCGEGRGAAAAAEKNAPASRLPYFEPRIGGAGGGGGGGGG